MRLRWPRWVAGRQGGSYRKMLLAQGGAWDLYVLHYPAGSLVGRHQDPVAEGKHHWRANLLLLGDQTFRVASDASPDDYWSLFGMRLVVFRPDRVPHRVAASPRARWVLSLGWVTDPRVT